MLQNASIKTKLAAILILPLLSLGVLAGMRVGDNLTRGRQADRMQDITTFALSLSGLVHELQRERDLSAGYVGSDKTSGYGRMIAQRVAVNQALKGFRGKLRRTDLTPYSQGLQARFRAAEASLGRLDDQRDQVGETGQPVTVASVLGYYNGVITELIDVNTQIPADADDSALAGTISTFVALSRAIEYTSRERGFLNAVLAGERFPPGATRELASIIGAEDTWLAQFRGLATPEQARQLDQAEDDPDMARAAALRRRILPDARPPNPRVDHKQWFLVMSAKIDLERAVAVRLASDVADVSQAGKLAADRAAVTSTTIIAVVLALTIGLSVVMARSMVRPLGILRQAANDVAERQLPGVVDRLQRDRTAEPDPETAPIGITSTDEIGQVARAFDSVHQVAVKIATEQALLRRDVADMFLNLARRSQSLVDRQLELIDDLEQGEPDPKALEDLFHLDHLATRMRRNAENLIVLSGAEPPRRWVEPIPLGDVVRGASAEVEGYTRVVVQRIQALGVSGQAASDVIHLLAELLENAAAFSPPETIVTVSAHPAAAGHVLEIEDRGIGIQPGDLEEINRRLEQSPGVDASLSRRMGLFVVGRLAARYGIKVRLRSSFYGGVTAMVLLPSEILVRLDPGPGELPVPRAEPANAG
jgi:signal transduction histidine kinase